MPSSQRTRRAVVAATGTALVGGCLGRVPSGGSNDSPAETPATAAEQVPSHDDPAPEGAWPQVGRDATRTGYNSTVSAAEPSVAWTTELDGVVTTPTVVGDTVYVTRGAPASDGPVGTVEAYALDDGSRQWSRSLGFGFTFHAPLSDHRPIYYRGALYVNVGNGVTALDAASGDRYWTADLAAGSDPPAVTDDGVYVGGRDGLHALNHDGTQRWRYPSAESKADEESRSSGFLSISPPAVGDDAVYLSVEERLAALDPTDGTERWSREHPGHRGHVVLGDDALVTTSHDRVTVVDLDGSTRWSATTNNLNGIRPAVADGTAYLAGLHGRAAAYDLASGEERWHTRFGPDTWSQGTVPVVLDGGVAVIDVQSGKVVVQALDPESGEALWERSQSGERCRGPVPASDHLVATAQPLPEDEEQTVSTGGDVTTTLWAMRPS